MTWLCGIFTASWCSVLHLGAFLCVLSWWRWVFSQLLLSWLHWELWSRFRAWPQTPANTWRAASGALRTVPNLRVLALTPSNIYRHMLRQWRIPVSGALLDVEGQSSGTWISFWPGHACNNCANTKPIAKLWGQTVEGEQLCGWARWHGGGDGI